ncbi:unnamed protein product [Peronospora belbahrii]|uniref:Uncharacterized protein n=1 Tax=Peronospora belbahrii TaxID=622444 RepID=A0AAU9KRN8_9STRA|nr:unnamed protein product [Peronospora belbahrii]CAH0520055.1 unnamed protein product [Peronospora belbahrii]
MTKDNASSTVRVCLTRCPLPAIKQQVHSLPCRIHYDGLAPVHTYFQPQLIDGNSNSTDHGGSTLEEQDVKVELDGKDNDNNMLHAEFRGIQLQGEKMSLTPMGFTGLVLEDNGIRHEEDEGRIWEIDDHFDELIWWDVPNHMTSEMHQLPLVLQQWHDLSSAIHTI